MIQLNYNLFSDLSVNSISKQTENSLWLETKEIKNELNLALSYENILRKYQHINKWVVLINPDKSLIDTLNKRLSSVDNQLNMSKVLCVHANKVNVRMESVLRTLNKGNCAALVLCNPTLNDEQLNQLSENAMQGKTPCIVITQNKTIH